MLWTSLVCQHLSWWKQGFHMQEIKIVTVFTICGLFLENYSYYHCLENYIFVIFFENS